MVNYLLVRLNSGQAGYLNAALLFDTEDPQITIRNRQEADARRRAEEDAKIAAINAKFDRALEQMVKAAHGIKDCLSNLKNVQIGMSETTVKDIACPPSAKLCDKTREERIIR
jgi:hypothetical protein